MKIQDNQLLLKVSNIAINSGIRIMEYYNNEIIVKEKEDKTPVTKADLDANDIILSELQKLEDRFPILSEESLVKWNKRKIWQKYWLVDPLDGTKEFINKNDEFTVNISLIENNKPVLGVIYAPALSLLYFAKKNFGSFKINSCSILNNLNDAKEINVLKKDKLRIIGSRSHSNSNFLSWVDKKFKNYDFIIKGSSLKFCEIAEGKADIYLRFGPTSEWDIAAGHIILEEAGGFLNDINGKEILYNTKESLINPEFIASNNNYLF
tara:strand:- start:95 stop:889 length:795 start_codon:yes stop_codon:yes gene_type:complete